MPARTFKKFFNQQSNIKGFTLIELLVAISIIAILSVIGVTLYSGAQKKARDAKRLTEVDAIAAAMETNYSGAYTQILNTMFATGVVPTDPINTNVAPNNTCPGVCKYCFREGASAQTPSACAQNSSTAAQGVGPLAGANQYWIICANLETTVNGLTYYCRASTQ
jgi:prepilin-type N-terminal cleavage/methylation domain-containing protein